MSRRKVPKFQRREYLIVMVGEMLAAGLDWREVVALLSGGCNMDGIRAVDSVGGEGLEGWDAADEVGGAVHF